MTTAEETAPAWVRTYDKPGIGWVESLEGIHWSANELPPIDHGCWPHTRYRLTAMNGILVEQCACGAERREGERKWRDRNNPRNRFGRIPPAEAARKRRGLFGRG